MKKEAKVKTLINSYIHTTWNLAQTELLFRIERMNISKDIDDHLAISGDEWNKLRKEITQ